MKPLDADRMEFARRHNIAADAADFSIAVESTGTSRKLATFENNLYGPWKELFKAVPPNVFGWWHFNDWSKLFLSWPAVARDTELAERGIERGGVPIQRKILEKGREQYQDIDKTWENVIQYLDDLQLMGTSTMRLVSSEELRENLSQALADVRRDKDARVKWSSEGFSNPVIKPRKIPLDEFNAMMKTEAFTWSAATSDTSSLKRSFEISYHGDNPFTGWGLYSENMELPSYLKKQR